MSEDLGSWIGKTQTRRDRITPVPMAALSATLDRDDPYPQEGDPVPPLWHWLWFWPIERQSDLGPEGHAKRGSFLPPIALPRRMWAGGRVEFARPLRVGELLTRESRITDIAEKQGRTGPLVFVTLRHEVRDASNIVLTEDQTLVYRDYAASPAQGEAAPGDAVWTRRVRVDDVLLFRYSALTFNGHRIHYDRRYAVETEGYPGLVVHGPLVATLLVDLLTRNLPDIGLSAFEFRALRPLFDTAPFTLCARPESDDQTARLWVSDPDGFLAMSATARFRTGPAEPPRDSARP